MCLHSDQLVMMSDGMLHPISFVLRATAASNAEAWKIAPLALNDDDWVASVTPPPPQTRGGGGGDGGDDDVPMPEPAPTREAAKRAAAGPVLVPKPNGRPPKGYTWDAVRGV